jgi:hypothetical protein
MESLGAGVTGAEYAGVCLVEGAAGGGAITLAGGGGV